MTTKQHGYKLLAVLALVMCAGVPAHAAELTYNYTVEGTVLLGDDALGPNAWGLSGGDVIIATGTFTADLDVGGDVVVSFGSGSGNSLSIDMLDGSFLVAGDDQNHGSGLPQLTFNSLALTDFNMTTADPVFNSNFLFFDDLGGVNGDLLGEWALTDLTVVPVPAAAWLFGSALLGLAGLRRRRR